MRLTLAGAALTALLGSGAGAEDGPAQPLAFSVRPSGIEEGETLDEKLARRERSFRFICIGCVRVPGSTTSDAPFQPIRTLNAPQLNRALAEPSAEAVPDLPP